jgi:hypothetical protein
VARLHKMELRFISGALSVWPPLVFPLHLAGVSCELVDLGQDCVVLRRKSRADRHISRLLRPKVQTHF